MKNIEILTLDDVKRNLRIDEDYAGEDTDLKMYLAGAREFVQSAVGCCDEEKARVRILVLTIVTQMYDKRSYAVESNDKVQKIIESIKFQLWTENLGDTQEEGTSDGN